MGLDLLKQQIEKKATEISDNLRDNLALDSIAKGEIIKALLEFQSFVLGLLANCVCIPTKQLENPKLSQKIMHWLVNHADLPLRVRAEMIIGLYSKELLEK